MTPKERAEYMIKSIFKEQHVDGRAIMICLSTTKIALWICDMNIGYVMEQGANDLIGNQIEYWTKVKEEIEKY